MYRSIRYWFIILLAAAHISFFTNIPDWWHNRKTFPQKVQQVREKFQAGVVLPLFALEEDYNYRLAIDEIAELGARRISFFVTSYQEDIRTNYIYLNLR